MENPHAYDEDRYVAASNRFAEAVAELWESGASEDDLNQQFADSLASAQ